MSRNRIPHQSLNALAIGDHLAKLARTPFPGQSAEAPSMGVGHLPGTVRVEFSAPVEYVDFSPEAAIEFAAQLLANANGAGYPNAMAIVYDTPPEPTSGTLTAEQVAELGAAPTFAETLEAAKKVADAALAELREAAATEGANNPAEEDPDRHPKA